MTKLSWTTLCIILALRHPPTLCGRVAFSQCVSSRFFLLSFRSIHTWSNKIALKIHFLDKTLHTSTLFSVILLDRRKSSLLYLKKGFLRKRSHMWETRTIEYHTKRMSLLSTSQIRKKERRKKSYTGSRSSLYLCITSSRCPCHLYLNFQVFVNETEQRKTSCVIENSVDDDL